MEPFDLVIRGGTVVTATDMMRADIGIRAERIAAIAEGLDAGRREIDARGLLVLPGGVDTHSHIEQLAATGLMNADTFELATRSAAFGGTTTVISFAAQHVGMNLTKVVEDYHRLADKGAVVDYAFHMILADPTEEVLYRQLPPLVREGHSSIKVFMTYDRLRIDDEKLLDVLAAARDNGALVMVHAENHGMINWMAKRLLSRGYVDPKYHGVAHPRVCETEAFTRLIACAALIDQPIMIYHVSTREGVNVIRARGDGLKVFAETCPQYLFLTKEHLDKPVCTGRNGFAVRRSATSPTRKRCGRDSSRRPAGHFIGPRALCVRQVGKLAAGEKPNFKQIANGMPGLQWRLPLVFDAVVAKGRATLSQFVAWTATEPPRSTDCIQKKERLRSVRMPISRSGTPTRRSRSMMRW